MAVEDLRHGGEYFRLLPQPRRWRPQPLLQVTQFLLGLSQPPAAGGQVQLSLAGARVPPQPIAFGKPLSGGETTA